jgi:hypothetical protein
VRDLWSRRDLSIVDREIAPVVAWHGAVLYRLSPVAPAVSTGTIASGRDLRL